jgi:type IX secretion system PorP/SprF family membrane protein
MVMKTQLHKSALLVLFFAMNHLYGQDLHFSQYNENPSLINPALTGANNVFRASAVYKDQWRSASVPFKTFGVSVESKFRPSNWSKVEGQAMRFTKNSFSRLAGGLSCYSDKAGDGNMSSARVNASLSSFVRVSERSNLSLGLQGSFVQRKIDFSKLVFSNQYTGSGYDASMVSGENTASQTFNYLNFSAGINWSYNAKENILVTSEQTKANIGFAVFNINEPKQVYLQDKNSNLAVRAVFHGDLLYTFHGTNIGIAPSYLLQFQGKNKELIAGTFIKYYIKDDSKYTGIILRSSINFGAFYRYGDALILCVNFDKRQKYSFGFSYDVNLSGFSKSTYLRGGPEFTLRYNTANAYLYQKKPKAE